MGAQSAPTPFDSSKGTGIGRGKIGIFGRLADWVMTHARLAVGVIVTLCILSALLASQLTVNPNILDLLPPEANTKPFKAEP